MDLSVVENGGNGGDFVRKTKDLLVIYGLENMPYLAMFGGNKEASTPILRLEQEQAFDWFGNSLLLDNQKVQLNSETERILDKTPLTSSGRQIIENTVKKDLAFMTAFATVSVSVSIIATDVVRIFISLKEPSNRQAKEFIYIWDATKKELQDPYNVNNAPAPVDDIGFNYILNFEFE